MKIAGWNGVQAYRSPLQDDAGSTVANPWGAFSGRVNGGYIPGYQRAQRAPSSELTEFQMNSLREFRADEAAKAKEKADAAGTPEAAAGTAAAGYDGAALGWGVPALMAGTGAAIGVAKGGLRGAVPGAAKGFGPTAMLANWGFDAGISGGEGLYKTVVNPEEFRKELANRGDHGDSVLNSGRLRGIAGTVMAPTSAAQEMVGHRIGTQNINRATEYQEAEGVGGLNTAYIQRLQANAEQEAAKRGITDSTQINRMKSEAVRGGSEGLTFGGGNNAAVTTDLAKRLGGTSQAPKAPSTATGAPPKAMQPAASGATHEVR